MPIIGFDDEGILASARNRRPVVVGLSEKGKIVLEMSNVLLRYEDLWAWQVINRPRWPHLTDDEWEEIDYLARCRAERIWAKERGE